MFTLGLSCVTSVKPLSKSAHTDLTGSFKRLIKAKSLAPITPAGLLTRMLASCSQVDGTNSMLKLAHLSRHQPRHIWPFGSWALGRCGTSDYPPNSCPGSFINGDGADAVQGVKRPCGWPASAHMLCSQGGTAQEGGA